ncbi:biopolymer transporter ExbD, partial [Vibrio furnissii]
DFGLTPDLTPLLDIIFIVMVFLMLTAAVKLDSLDVSLPTSDS